MEELSVRFVKGQLFHKYLSKFQPHIIARSSSLPHFHLQLHYRKFYMLVKVMATIHDIIWHLYDLRGLHAIVTIARLTLLRCTLESETYIIFDFNLVISIYSKLLHMLSF